MLLGLDSTLLRSVILQPVRTQGAKAGQHLVLIRASAPHASYGGEHYEHERGHNDDRRHGPVNNIRSVDDAQDS